MAFLLLGIGYADRVDGAPRPGAIKAGGAFGILASFLAWYNALAGIADSSNRYGRSRCIEFQLDETQALTLWQFLLGSRRSLPLVREGPRDSRQGRQQRGPRS